MGLDELFLQSLIESHGDQVDISLHISGTTRESWSEYRVHTCRTGTFTARKPERVLDRIREAYEGF